MVSPCLILGMLFLTRTAILQTLGQTMASPEMASGIAMPMSMNRSLSMQGMLIKPALPTTTTRTLLAFATSLAIAWIMISRPILTPKISTPTTRPFSVGLLMAFRSTAPMPIRMPIILHLRSAVWFQAIRNAMGQMEPRILPLWGAPHFPLGLQLFKIEMPIFLPINRVRLSTTPTFLDVILKTTTF